MSSHAVRRNPVLDLECTIADIAARAGREHKERSAALPRGMAWKDSLWSALYATEQVAQGFLRALTRGTLSGLRLQAAADMSPETIEALVKVCCESVAGPDTTQGFAEEWFCQQPFGI